jgi:hypothetical protein
MPSARQVAAVNAVNAMTMATIRTRHRGRTREPPSAAEGESFEI